MSFSFRLHINETNDGAALARVLRGLAARVDGQHLTPGMRLDVEHGYAKLFASGQADEYPSCAEAERRLGITLQWAEYGPVHDSDPTHWIGRFDGIPLARVVNKERVDGGCYA